MATFQYLFIESLHFDLYRWIESTSSIESDECIFTIVVHKAKVVRSIKCQVVHNIWWRWIYYHHPYWWKIRAINDIYEVNQPKRNERTNR